MGAVTVLLALAIVWVGVMLGGSLHPRRDTERGLTGALRRTRRGWPFLALCGLGWVTVTIGEAAGLRWWVAWLSGFTLMALVGRLLMLNANVRDRLNEALKP
jgi:hypothetical protein